MKTLKEALINKKSIKHIIHNKYNITKYDLYGELKGFPIGVVVRMLEEQEEQGNKPDIDVFRKRLDVSFYDGGFNWGRADGEYDFWFAVIEDKKFDVFYEKYPEYKRYDR